MTLLAVLLALAAAAPAPIQFNVQDILWAAGSKALPAGTTVAVLEGDPKASGIFTMRVRLPAGARLGAHVHPREERVTVISGSVMVGFGASFDAKRGRAFRAGAFYVNPARAPHFVWTDEGAELQITGAGPWEIKFL